jgi:serine/arginine repetitive matrix protein 2
LLLFRIAGELNLSTELKGLQTTYCKLVSNIQTAVEKPPAQPRTTSPTPFHLPRPQSRARSNTNPAASQSSHQTRNQVSTALYTINSKYKVSWECAELLIELGGGTTTPALGAGANTKSPPTSISAPAMQHIQGSPSENRKSRERAIPLVEDDTKRPTPAMILPCADTSDVSWCSSTGRHDLSQRQLVILREMLNTTDGTLQIPE